MYTTHMDTAHKYVVLNFSIMSWRMYTHIFLTYMKDYFYDGFLGFLTM
jgi:hypothetical protein